jgi:M6 family metalloprotease-like protein
MSRREKYFLLRSLIVLAGVWMLALAVVIQRPAANDTPGPLPTQAVLSNRTQPTPAPVHLSPTDTPADPLPLPVQPTAEPVPNQVVIRFAETASETERAAYLAAVAATSAITRQIAALNTVVLSVPDPAALPDSPVILSREPDYRVTALIDVPTSDPHYSDQWGLRAIGAPEAWLQLPAQPASVTVAVIDSGICADHPDLAGRILTGYDFVEDDSTPQDAFGHGCGVSGVIAANADNGLGIAGVAPHTQILPLRVLDAQGSGTYSDVAAALVYAADSGAQIINLSLGGTQDSRVLRDAVQYAADRGARVVAAAGNTGSSVLYPAAYPAAVAVGSVSSRLTLSTFSSRGPEIDLLAPGENILTTTRAGSYAPMNGTSFAAPHVAGAAALQLALGRELTLDGGVVWLGGANLPVTPTVVLTPEPASTPHPRPAQVDIPLRVMVPSPDTAAQMQAQGLTLATLFPQMDIARAFSPGPRMNVPLVSGQTTSWRMLAILVQFPDNPASVSAASFDSFLYGTTGKTVRNYYREVSYNQLDVVTVNLPGSTGWRTAPQPYSYYVNGDNCLSNNYPRNCPRLVEDLVQQVNPLVNFADYDNNGDGWVDTVMVIHAGPGAEFTGNPNHIWSHASGTWNPPLVDGVRVGPYIMNPEYWLNPGDITRGVFVHEMGHAFGLPDLYDVDGSSSGVGRWSLMGAGAWNGTLGADPAHLDAWSRLYLGYATAVDATVMDQTISLPNVEQNSTGAIYRLNTGFNPNEYFLLENRQPIGTDLYLPSHGLLIWHVDTSITGNNSRECRSHNNWLCGINHFRVALEQADGLLHLEYNNNQGDLGDPYPGSTNKRIFNFASTPNTSSYYSSADPCFRVSNISNSASTMTAQVGSSCRYNIPAGDTQALINAIIEKNTSPNDYPIYLAANSTYTLTATYTGDGDVSTPHGLPAIRQNIRIIGNGATIQRSAAASFQVFHVLAGGELILENLTVQNGAATGSGGAVENRGTLRLNNVSLLNNTAAVYGGAVANFGGGVLIQNSRLSGNAAGSGGSAFYHTGAAGPLLQITGSRIIDNCCAAVLNANPAVALNAANNWWGAADGPSGVGPGSGDAVSSYVTYTPFLTLPPSVCSSVSQIPASECAALEALYASTAGPNWFDNTGWLDTNTPCEWYGVLCYSGRVSDLWLDYNNLTGTLPAQIGALTGLQTLDLTGNNLISPIPTQIGSLTQLWLLSLADNQFSGVIPTSLGSLTNLYYLWLDFNQFSGSIPTQITGLPNLRDLDLSDNLLTGVIPTNLGSRVNLRYLDLSNNNLTGSILASLGNLTQLQYLYLWDNSLTGSIPTTLGSLSNLRVLSLGFNQLTGGIPTQLGNLAALEELYLNNNQLSGGIPPALGNLTALRWLNLGGNPLGGSIPSQLGGLTNLIGLYLYNNQLGGPIPAALDNLNNLQWLNLGDNQLTGTIPAALLVEGGGGLAVIPTGFDPVAGALAPHRPAPPSDAPAAVKRAYARRLAQQPAMPEQPLSGQTLNSLLGLWLYNNQLYGPMPAELGNLTGLLALDLSGNLFSGPIPATIGNLINLDDLNLSRNRLSGEVPASIANLTGLITLDIGYNRLRSTNPAVIAFLDWKDPDWASTQDTVSGSLSGTVYDSAGATPRANTPVTVRVEGYPAGDTVASVSIYADGTFYVALPPGEYTTAAVGPGLALEYYQEAGLNRANATVLTLNPGADITGVNFTLADGGSISGRVTNADTGLPLANVFVGLQEPGWRTCTNAAGQYRFDNLALDQSYTVFAGGPAQGCTGAGDYPVEWWQEADRAANATPVTLTAASRDRTTIHFTLDRTPPLLAPVNLAALAVGLDRIDLSWSDPNLTATHIVIERSQTGLGNWLPLATVSIDSTTYSHTSLACGSTRYYRARAFRSLDGQYSPYSAVASATTAACPPLAAPALNAAAAGRTQAQLSWTQPETADRFDLERAGNSGGWTLIAQYAAHRASHTDSGLACGQTYSYRVRAWRGADSAYSAYSNEAAVTQPPCPAPNPHTVGLYRAGIWQFWNTNQSGAPAVVFPFGPAETGWQAVTGDWDGDGTDGIGLYKNGLWLLRDISNGGPVETAFAFGPAETGWLPVVGDWNGDGRDGIGLYKDGVWHLRQTATAGTADLTFRFSPAGSGWLPVAGDWNGSGSASVGLYKDGLWLLSNSLPALADVPPFIFGPPTSGWTPLSGDWNADGIATAGVFKEGQWLLSNGGGLIDTSYIASGAGWQPIASYRGGPGALALLAQIVSTPAPLPTSEPAAEATATQPPAPTATPEPEVSETTATPTEPPSPTPEPTIAPTDPLPTPEPPAEGVGADGSA